MTWGDLQLIIHPQSERWRNNRGGGSVCFAGPNMVEGLFEA